MDTSDAWPRSLVSDSACRHTQSFTQLCKVVRLCDGTTSSVGRSAEYTILLNSAFVPQKGRQCRQKTCRRCLHKEKVTRMGHEEHTKCDSFGSEDLRTYHFLYPLLKLVLHFFHLSKAFCAINQLLLSAKKRFGEDHS
jgi:hypothetical protein